MASDIGLIFLSHRLTVPSFPSKTLDYFKTRLPVLAALDSYTDFGRILEEDARAGYAAIANDTKTLGTYLKNLAESEELRKELGRNGREYYESEFDVGRAKNIILNQFKEV